MKPIYCAFYTLGTLYEREAERLRGCLDRLGLEHDLCGIKSFGDWKANSGYTPRHIQQMMQRHPNSPIVQLDADAYLHEYPALFDSLDANQCDIAVHYRQGHELLNGTLWIAPTEAAKAVIDRYAALVAQSWPHTHNEQRFLQKAIEQTPGLRVHRLPTGYCWIHDVMANDLAEGEPIVIEHLQASRETNVSHLTAHRRTRIAELENK